MAEIPLTPDPTLAAPLEVFDDADLYIRLDEAQREQPIDSTYRPDKPAATQRGTRFIPLSIDPLRKPRITELPPTPLSLFQAFVPESLVKSWAGYTNQGLPPDQVSNRAVFKEGLRESFKTQQKLTEAAMATAVRLSPRIRYISCSGS